ncbi:MAG: Rieske 2Fe-2S domain-containing protein [Blastococcus sp.]
MLVVTFAVSGGGNCAIVGDAPYVYARTEAGSFVLPARCLHRGGPLNLAGLPGGSTRVVCPWHDRATSVTRLVRKGIPAVRRGDVVTAVFPEGPDTAHHLEHRPMSRELIHGRRPRTADRFPLDTPTITTSGAAR